MKGFLLIFMVLSLSVHAQTTYNGNGNTLGGGIIGNGSLVVSNDGTNINFHLNKGANFDGTYILVLYFNSVSRFGFSSTAGFNDFASDNSKAVSGVGWGGRSTLSFPLNFGADYALAWGAAGSTLYKLAEGNNNTMTAIGANDASTTDRSILKTDIGITGTIQFQLIGTLLAPSGYRTHEAFEEVLNPNSNIGFNPVSFSTTLGYPDITLNASISQFGAAWQASQGARLNWQINCSSGSVSMKLERSQDGRNFEVIHSELASAPRCAAPFTYNDLQAPASGAFYRMAIQNDNGRIHYSKVARLQKNGMTATRMLLTPTLAQSEIWLQTNLALPELLSIRIVDAQGKLLQHQQQQTEKGMQNIRLSVSQLSTGIYYLQVQGSKPGGSEILRFVKQ